MMPITVEAVYENGVLKPAAPLPLKEHDRVTVSITPAAPHRPAVVPWTGPVEDLDYLIRDPDNDPLEAP